MIAIKPNGTRGVHKRNSPPFPAATLFPSLKFLYFGHTCRHVHAARCSRYEDHEAGGQEQPIGG